MKTYYEVRELLANKYSLYGSCNKIYKAALYVDQFDIVNEHFQEDIKECFYISIDFYKDSLNPNIEKIAHDLNQRWSMYAMSESNNIIEFNRYVVLVHEKDVDYFFKYIEESEIFYHIINIMYFNVNYKTYQLAREYIRSEFNLDLTKMLIKSSYSLYTKHGFELAIYSLDPTSDINNMIEWLLKSEGISYNKQEGKFSQYTAFNVTKKFITKFNLIKEPLGLYINSIMLGSEFYKRFEE